MYSDMLEPGGYSMCSAWRLQPESPMSQASASSTSCSIPHDKLTSTYLQTFWHNFAFTKMFQTLFSFQYRTNASLSCHKMELSPSRQFYRTVLFPAAHSSIVINGPIVSKAISMLRAGTRVWWLRGQNWILVKNSVPMHEMEKHQARPA